MKMSGGRVIYLIMQYSDFWGFFSFQKLEATPACSYLQILTLQFWLWLLKVCLFGFSWVYTISFGFTAYLFFLLPHFHVTFLTNDLQRYQNSFVDIFHGRKQVCFLCDYAFYKNILILHSCSLHSELTICDRSTEWFCK